MSKKIKVYIKFCLYWISVVGPLYDIVAGAIKGIKSSITTAKEQVRQLNIEKMKKEFDDVNQ